MLAGTGNLDLQQAAALAFQHIHAAYIVSCTNNALGHGESIGQIFQITGAAQQGTMADAIEFQGNGLFARQRILILLGQGVSLCFSWGTRLPPYGGRGAGITKICLAQVGNSLGPV